MHIGSWGGTVAPQGMPWGRALLQQRGDPRGSVGVPRPLPQPWQRWLGQGSFCSKNRVVKGCPVAWRVSHPTVGITPHCEYCILLWASHPTVGIAPHYRHCTPLWASHPIVGIASYCGHHTPLWASHPVVCIAPHPGHHTPRPSHPITCVTPHPGLPTPSQASHPIAAVVSEPPQAPPGSGAGGSLRQPHSAARRESELLALPPHLPCKHHPWKWAGCSLHYRPVDEPLVITSCSLALRRISGVGGSLGFALG